MRKEIIIRGATICNSGLRVTSSICTGDETISGKMEKIAEMRQG